jgi:hypothetical protein
MEVGRTAFAFRCPPSQFRQQTHQSAAFLLHEFQPVRLRQSQSFALPHITNSHRVFTAYTGVLRTHFGGYEFRKVPTMAMSEAQRFELHLGLQKLMGEPMATTFMENVPPSGWSDVAQRSDLSIVERELRSDMNDIRSEINNLRSEVNNLRIDLDRVRVDVDRLDRKLNMVIGIGLTFGLALLALQVQIMLSIASL